jgi:CRP-like cAMP-binding protein/phosphoribosyl 1,2-cyclic phosphodiesterase
MKIRFWGTRGSVPTPGPRTARFGGNTSCIEVRADDGTCLVIDCGTGAREMGAHLLAEHAQPPDIHLLIGHTHWDHIQGFPFFGPAYVPGCLINVYSPPGLEDTLEASLSGQMQYTYFPVRLNDLRARILFRELGEGRFQVGGLTVETQYLNHTAPSLGYRLSVGGTTIVYASDHEPYWWPGQAPRKLWSPVHPGDVRHLAFLEGADVLIHDAQYLDREYPAKRGWGHSTVNYVTDLACLAGVRQLVLFHHDPTHDDRFVATTARAAARRAAGHAHDLQVLAAAEGMEIVLPERREIVAPSSATPTVGSDGVVWGARLLVAGAEQEDWAALRDALAPDGHRLLSLSPGESLPAAVARLHPALVILVASPDLPNPLRAATELRHAAGGTEIPVLAVVGADLPPRVVELLAEAMDFVTRPWSPPMLRSRVRSWLARAPGGRPRRTRPPAARRQPVTPSEGSPVPDLFRGLPARELAALLGAAATCRFAPGEILYRQDEPGGGVYHVRTGALRVSTSTANGQEIVLAVLGPGNTVGELAALDEGPHTATVMALEPTVADHVGRDVFVDALGQSPQASLRLLRLMASRLRSTNRLMGDLALVDLPGRIARQLCESIEAQADRAVAIDTLATAVGVDPPGLRRALGLLESAGLIRVSDDRAEVLDRGALEQLAGP